MQAKSPTPNDLNHHLLSLGVCISKKLGPGTDRREPRDLIQDMAVIFVYELCILYLERQSVRERLTEKFYSLEISFTAIIIAGVGSGTSILVSHMGTLELSSTAFPD